MSIPSPVVTVGMAPFPRLMYVTLIRSQARSSVEHETPEKAESGPGGARSAGQGGQRLPDLDDVGGEHPSGSRPEIGCVVGGTGRDEESVTGLQGECGVSPDL